MLNLQLIEQEITTNPLYRYHSDQISTDWEEDKIKLLKLAKEEKLFFFTWCSHASGIVMFALTDEYIPEALIELGYDILYNPMVELSDVSNLSNNK